MKAKILLGLLVINCAFVGIYLAIRPTPVEAEDTEPRAAEQARQQFQQPMVFNVSDQIEILRQKEERLKARELELKELEGQIQGKIKRLEDIEAAIKSDLASYRFVSSERVKHLVKIYSSMKPGAAATLMNNLDTDVAVEVFSGHEGRHRRRHPVLHGAGQGRGHHPATRELPERRRRVGEHGRPTGVNRSRVGPDGLIFAPSSFTMA
jgi:flagellar motility protein MotE (MotC chaperone)